MNNIGIGITTRNRPEVLADCLNHFEKFHTNEDLYVVIDDNSDNFQKNQQLIETFKSKISAKVVYKRSQSRLGIAAAKNECLLELQDCSNVFLFDDDCWPIAPGWSLRWVDVCKENKIHHAMFNVGDISLLDLNPAFKDWMRYDAVLNSGENTVISYQNCFGAMLYFTRECLDAIGGYDESGGSLYGYEHAQVSQRASKVGHLSVGYPYLTPKIATDILFSMDISYAMLGLTSPLDLSCVSTFCSSVNDLEKSNANKNACLMGDLTVYKELKGSKIKNKQKVDVIIPTKSNFSGLYQLIDSLQGDDSIGEVVVIAHGENAYNTLLPMSPGRFTLLTMSIDHSLHQMWNMGMDYFSKSPNYLAIINDDVVLTDKALDKVATLLFEDPSIGLVSPWSDINFKDKFANTTGFAGFCMVLNNELSKKWRFDERMKWWFGDTDIIRWVSETMKKQTGITGLCHAIGNKSETITKDPPPNFHSEIHNDMLVYHAKWRM